MAKVIMHDEHHGTSLRTFIHRLRRLHRFNKTSIRMNGISGLGFDERPSGLTVLHLGNLRNLWIRFDKSELPGFILRAQARWIGSTNIFTSRESSPPGAT